jgi:hypothetical protein
MKVAVQTAEKLRLRVCLVCGLDKDKDLNNSSQLSERVTAFIIRLCINSIYLPKKIQEVKAGRQSQQSVTLLANGVEQRNYLQRVFKNRYDKQTIDDFH